MPGVDFNDGSLFWAMRTGIRPTMDQSMAR